MATSSVHRTGDNDTYNLCKYDGCALCGTIHASVPRSLVRAQRKDIVERLMHARTREPSSASEEYRIYAWMGRVRRGWRVLE